MSRLDTPSLVLILNTRQALAVADLIVKSEGLIVSHPEMAWELISVFNQIKEAMEAKVKEKELEL